MILTQSTEATTGAGDEDRPDMEAGRCSNDYLANAGIN